MTQRYADIAIRVAQNPPEHLVGHEVRTLSWGIYGTESDAATDDLSTLFSRTFIGACGTLHSHPVFKWLETRGSETKQHQCDDLVAMAHLARAIPGLKLLAPLSDIASNKLWVLTHPDLRHIERIKQSMRWISKSLRSEPRLSQAV